MLKKIALIALCGAMLPPRFLHAGESSLSQLAALSRGLGAATSEPAPIAFGVKVGPESAASPNSEPAIPPLQAAKGAVLDFYLQTRMRPDPDNVLDGLPKGTKLRVKLLDAIDSVGSPGKRDANRDGDAFRGELASPLLSPAEEVLVPAGARAEGLFVLLRSRSHPDGLRYELLVTKLVDGPRSYDFTASLSPSI